MTALRLLLLIASLVACSTSGSAAAGELDSYRSFVRTDEARLLLSVARAAMVEAFAPQRSSAEARTEAEGTRSKPAPEETAAPDAAAIFESDWPGTPVGVYVSLARGPATRACVGTATPARGTLHETVRTLAREALHADRRRPPVRVEELAGLRIVLSFAAEGDRIASPYRVDPGREGLLIGTVRGSIAFLPGEARTVQWAMGEARRAGVIVGAGTDAVYRRLEVVTLSESSRTKGDENDEAH